MSLREARQSVVRILGASDESTSQGSGTCVDQHLIVTNVHVVHGTRSLHVVGEEHKVSPARLVAVDRQLDLALLRVVDSWFPPLESGSVEGCEEGEPVWALGYPLGREFAQNQGHITTIRSVERGQTYLRTDAHINAGNSGGPLVNESGEAIGLNTFSLSAHGERRVEGFHFAIPIDRVLNWVADVKDGHGQTPSGGRGCPNCGNSLPRTAMFCPSCGAELVEESSPNTKTPALSPHTPSTSVVLEVLDSFIEEILEAAESGKFSWEEGAGFRSRAVDLLEGIMGEDDKSLNQIRGSEVEDHKDARRLAQLVKAARDRYRIQSAGSGSF